MEPVGEDDGNLGHSASLSPDAVGEFDLEAVPVGADRIQVDRLKRGTLPARAACITFDDGYRDNFEVACPILQRYGLTGTFFVATDFLDGGRMFNDTVIEAVRRIPTGKVDLSWVGLGEMQVDDIASRAALMSAFIKAIKYLPIDERAQASERQHDQTLKIDHVINSKNNAIMSR